MYPLLHEVQEALVALDQEPGEQGVQLLLPAGA